MCLFTFHWQPIIALIIPKITPEAQKLKKKSNKSKTLHERDERLFSGSLLCSAAHLSWGHFFVYAIMKLLYYRCVSAFTWSRTQAEWELTSVPTTSWVDITANTALNMPVPDPSHVAPWLQVNHWTPINIYFILLSFYKYSALKINMPAYWKIILQHNYITLSMHFHRGI